MKTSLLVFTLNEIEGMKIIMPQIDKNWIDEILVVDGGSSDGTIEWARENGYKVVLQDKQGLRNAYVTALQFMTGDVAIAFSPDGNSLPEVIPDLVSKIREGYDVVVASRYAEGARSLDDDWLTGIGNWFFPRFVNLLYGSKYTDVLGMYRAWTVEAFQLLELDQENTFATEDKLFGEVIGCEPLMSVRIAKRRLKYAEVPGDEPPRIGGKRKLKPYKWGAAHLYQILREKFVWK